MLRLVHHAVSALRSCIQLKRWGFEPSLSSCFSYTLSVIVAMWMKTGSFLQLCASVSLYFAVKFSFPVCLILHHSTKGKQIPVTLYAAPAGHHPPARRSVVPPRRRCFIFHLCTWIFTSCIPKKLLLGFISQPHVSVIKLREILLYLTRLAGAEK